MRDDGEERRRMREEGGEVEPEKKEVVGESEKR